MNWEAIGAIGQMLGSVAVLVTLIYLAAQVREARESVRRAIAQGRSDGLRELIAQACESRFMSATQKAEHAFVGQSEQSRFVSLLMEQAGLTQEEGFLVSSLQYSWWSYRSAIIPYADELPPIDRVTFENGIRGTYGRPGVHRHFYELAIKPSAHPDAVRYIERLLATPISSDPTKNQRPW